MTSSLKNLPCQTWGSPSSPAVLFLHGFMGSGASWLPIAERLQERWFCLAPDLPGHGSAGCSPGLTLQTVTELILSTLTQRGIRRCHLVGYSLGGRLGLHLMLYHRERFSGVVLESASPGLETASERSARAALDATLANKLRTGSLEAFLRDWYALPLFALGDDPALQASLVERRSANDPAHLATILEALSVSRQEDFWPLLRLVEAPWLYLAGERDTKYMAFARRIAAQCPAASVAIMPDCGHNTHLQQPDAFAARLQTHFQKEART